MTDLFGGESYQPYMYHNAVNKLMLPEPHAQAMIDYAGGPLGGGKSGGGGKRHGGARNRAARLGEADAGRAAAEADVEPGFLAAASAAAERAQSGVAALSAGVTASSVGSSVAAAAGPNALLYGAPAGLLVAGLAVFGLRSRRVRSR